MNIGDTVNLEPIGKGHPTYDPDTYIIQNIIGNLATLSRETEFSIIVEINGYEAPTLPNLTIAIYNQRPTINVPTTITKTNDALEIPPLKADLTDTLDNERTRNTLMMSMSISKIVLTKMVILKDYWLQITPQKRPI